MDGLVQFALLGGAFGDSESPGRHRFLVFSAGAVFARMANIEPKRSATTRTGVLSMKAAEGVGNGGESLLASHNDRSRNTPKVTVAIIDDDRSVRNALVRSVQAAGYTAEAFSSAIEFIEHPALETVSCVVSDLRMPGLNGLQLQELLQSKIPFLSMIFVTGYGDVPASVGAMKAGAVDFLEKPIKRSALLEAIRSAIERTSKQRASAIEIRKMKTRYERLTPRERDVFVLVSAGLLNKQVAAQLGTAEKTVKQHRGSIMRKIDAESVADLAIMADHLGIRPTGANFAEAKGKLSA
jgi:FixJ family two-component response regulator